MPKTILKKQYKKFVFKGGKWDPVNLKPTDLITRTPSLPCAVHDFSLNNQDT